MIINLRAVYITLLNEDYKDIDDGGFEYPAKHCQGLLIPNSPEEVQSTNLNEVAKITFR